MKTMLDTPPITSSGMSNMRFFIARRKEPALFQGPTKEWIDG